MTIRKLVSLHGSPREGKLAYAHVDLRCAWMALAELPELTLHDATITSACFEASTLDGADLLECTGSHVDFRSASMRGAILQACELPYARFAGADLSGARLVDCAMQGCAFDGAACVGALTKQSDLRRATFVHADLRGAVFVDCDLRDARFGGGSATNLRLVRCDLGGVAWPGLEAAGVDLVDCVNVPRALRRSARHSAVCRTIPTLDLPIATP